MSKKRAYLLKVKGETLKETAAPYRASLPVESYSLQTREDQGWADFRDQCRRQMQRSVADRIKYGFSRRIKPSPGEMGWRAFKTMAEYRAWCEANMPDYLGFKRPAK